MLWEIARLGHGSPRMLGTCDGGSTPASGLGRWRDNEHSHGHRLVPGNYGAREPGESTWSPFLLETSNGQFRSIRAGMAQAPGAPDSADI